METREQLLSRYSGLKEKARKLAKVQNHLLEPFERIRTTGHAKCLQCSAEVWIKLFPRNNETEISGSAVTVTCKVQP